MKKSFLLVMLLSALLFTGCGQQHDAQSHVKEFMKAQLGITDYDVVAWGQLDSTFFVTDSMVEVMHHKASSGRNISYVKATPKLHFITLKYAVDKDTLSKTFYLDEPMTGIVAVK